MTGYPRHGHRPAGKPSPTYTSWAAMRQRCLNPRASHYERYGGRGIQVDPRWDRFEAFLSDMGERPDGMELERENNDGDYSPSNCRWATRSEQLSNTSRSVLVEYNGEKLTLTAWAARFGINFYTLRSRLKRGLTFEEATRC